MVNGELNLAGQPWGALLQLFPAPLCSSIDEIVTNLVQFLSAKLESLNLSVLDESEFLGTRVLECVEWLDSESFPRPESSPEKPHATRDRREAQSLPGSLPDALLYDDIGAQRQLNRSEATEWPRVLEVVSPQDREVIRGRLIQYLGQKKIAGLVLVGYEYDSLFPQVVEIDIYKHGERFHLHSREVDRISGPEDARLLSYSMDEEVRAFRDGVHPDVIPKTFEDYVISPGTILKQTVSSILDALNGAASDREAVGTHAIRLASLAATEYVAVWEECQATFAEGLSGGLAMLPLRMLPWAARVQVEHTILRAATRPEIPKVGAPVSVAAVSRESGFQLVSEEARFVIPQPRQSQWHTHLEPWDATAATR